MSTFTLVYTRALKIYASDNNVPIPNPNLIASGTSTSAATGKLINSAGLFVTKGISVGDVVYNTANQTAAVVTGVDSETQLSVSADIFATSPKTYRVYQNSSTTGNPNNGAYLYVTSTTTTDTALDIAVITLGGDSVTFTAVPKGTILPVQVTQVKNTGTTSTASFLALW
jgi:hypothetical protein